MQESHVADPTTYQAGYSCASYIHEARTTLVTVVLITRMKLLTQIWDANHINLCLCCQTTEEELNLDVEPTPEDATEEVTISFYFFK